MVYPVKDLEGAPFGADTGLLGLLYHICMVYPVKDLEGAPFGADTGSLGLLYHIFVIPLFEEFQCRWFPLRRYILL